MVWFWYPILIISENKKNFILSNFLEQPVNKINCCFLVYRKLHQWEWECLWTEFSLWKLQTTSSSWGWICRTLGDHYHAHLISSPASLEVWDPRPVPPCSPYLVLETEWKGSCRLNQDSTTRTTSLVSTYILWFQKH